MIEIQGDQVSLLFEKFRFFIIKKKILINVGLLLII